MADSFVLFDDCVNVLIIGCFVCCKCCKRVIGKVESEVNGLRICRIFGARSLQMIPDASNSQITGDLMRFTLQDVSNRLKRKSDFCLAEFEPMTKRLCVDQPELIVFQISRIELDRMFAGIRSELEEDIEEEQGNVLLISDEEEDELDIILDWDRMTEYLGYFYYFDGDSDQFSELESNSDSERTIEFGKWLKKKDLCLFREEN